MKPTNIYIRRSELLRKLMMMHHNDPKLSVSTMLKALRLKNINQLNS